MVARVPLANVAVGDFGARGLLQPCQQLPDTLVCPLLRSRMPRGVQITGAAQRCVC